MRVLRFCAVMAALLSLFDGIVSGQVLYGSLVGNVTDPQQAAVVGAVVTIKNNSTGYSLETTTDDRGVYEFGNIPPGAYDNFMAITSTISTVTNAQRSIRFGLRLAF